MFERTRTFNLLIRSQTLYPIELQTQKIVVFLYNCYGWDRRIRTFDTLYQKQVPYHLAMSQKIVKFLQKTANFVREFKRFSNAVRVPLTNPLKDTILFKCLEVDSNYRPEDFQSPTLTN